MSETPRRVLIVGAGRIAGLNETDPVRQKPCTHAGAVLRNPGLSLLGVVDTDADRARAFADTFGLNFSGTNVVNALEQLAPDIVTVAVPYQRQADVVAAVLSASHRPVRMLLEKPLSDTLERATAIVEGCRREGIALIVNNECVAPVYDQVAALLADRFEGEVISASAWCSSGMHAVGVHMLGVLRRLFGEVSWVQAVAETEHVESLPFSTNFVADDPRVHAMLAFDSGVTGFLTNSALTRYTYKEIEVMCRSGRIRLSDNGNRLSVSTTAPPGESTLSYRLRELEDMAVEPGTAFTRLGELMAGDEVQAAAVGVSGFDGLATYRLLEAMRRSSAQCRPIALSELHAA